MSIYLESRFVEFNIDVKGVLNSCEAIETNRDFSFPNSCSFLSKRKMSSSAFLTFVMFVETTSICLIFPSPLSIATALSE